MNKDDSQQPPLGEEKEPDSDSSETPESPSDPNADTAPKPRKRGFGKFLFILILLIGTAGGTAYYYELKQKKFRQDLESRLYTLGRAANDRPHQNSKDLHFLTEKLQQFQVQVADSTRRQTETIEALRQEINQLKAQIKGGTVQPVEAELPQSDQGPEEAPEDLKPEAESTVPEPNEEGGGEAPPGPVEEQPAPEPTVEETQPTEEPTETLAESEEEEETPEAEDPEPVDVAEAVTAPEEEGSAEQEVPVEEEPESTPTESPDHEVVESQEAEEETVPQEPVEAIATESVVVAHPETVVIVPASPQPEPTPEESDLKRTEGEQEYIDFVETTSGKFFRLVGEGASKLWDYLSGLF